MWMATCHLPTCPLQVHYPPLQVPALSHQLRANVAFVPSAPESLRQMKSARLSQTRATSRARWPSRGLGRRNDNRFPRKAAGSSTRSSARSACRGRIQQDASDLTLQITANARCSNRTDRSRVRIQTGHRRRRPPGHRAPYGGMALDSRRPARGEPFARRRGPNPGDCGRPSHPG